MTLDNMTGITEGSYTGFCKSQLITCNRVKECNGVCPFEDALKHADKMQTMNEQHTVDHDRDWIIGCIEHDGFINTDRFDKANQIILDALSAEAEWIPCSERLPEIACRCLVTLSNNIVAVGTLHSEGEYEDDFGYIVNWGKRWHLEPASMMIAYHEDSVIAWMPLPEPYKGGDIE